MLLFNGSCIHILAEVKKMFCKLKALISYSTLDNGKDVHGWLTWSMKIST